MKFFDFGAFQKIEKMLSHDKILFHMIFGAFYDTPCILKHKIFSSNRLFYNLVKRVELYKVGKRLSDGYLKTNPTLFGLGLQSLTIHLDQRYFAINRRRSSRNLVHKVRDRSIGGRFSRFRSWSGPRLSKRFGPGPT